MSEAIKARFNENDHCISDGWATYHRDASSWRCARGHKLPPKPVPPNGIAPACYERCSRCDLWLKWFVCGQHRYGGIDA